MKKDSGRKLLIALCLGLGAAAQAAPASGSPVAAGAVKWHPGHYAAIERKQNSKPAYFKGLYADLDATPALRGVLLRFTWSELEPSKGNYDFRAIEQHLNELAAHHKQLIILLETKSFGYSNDIPIAPDYVLNDAEFEGGAFKFPAGPGAKKGQAAPTGRRGSNLKLWNPRVYERLSAMLEALGKHFNAHPNFEALVLQETAMGLSEESTTPAQEDGFFDNLLKLHAQLRTNFPNTATIQLTNYPLRKLGLLTSGFKTMGTGLGGPDIFVSDPGLNRPGGIYSYYSKLSGVVPLAPMVATENYVAARHGGPASEAANVDQLYSFARDRLKANYIFWARPSDRSNYFPRVVEILNQPELRADPAGGLSKACPSAFASCTN